MKPIFVFDYNLRTKDEIKKIDSDEMSPPVWFDRLTVDIINSGDLCGRQYSISEFKFKRSLFEEGDCEIWTDLGVIRVAHDIVSDEFCFY